MAISNPTTSNVVNYAGTLTFVPGGGTSVNGFLYLYKTAATNSIPSGSTITEVSINMSVVGYACSDARHITCSGTLIQLYDALIEGDYETHTYALSPSLNLSIDGINSNETLTWYVEISGSGLETIQEGIEISATYTIIYEPPTVEEYAVYLTSYLDGTPTIDIPTRVSASTATPGTTIRVTVPPTIGASYKYSYYTVNDVTQSSMTFTMPDRTAYVSVYYVTTYTVTLNTGSNGSATLSTTSAGAGDTITVNISPNTGYTLDYVYVNGSVSSVILSSTKTIARFTMPAANSTVTVAFKRMANSYSISYGCFKQMISGTNHADVSYDYTDCSDLISCPTSAEENSIVSYSISLPTPSADWELVSLSIDNMGIDVTALAFDENGVWEDEFLMPSYDVDIIATIDRTQFVIDCPSVQGGNGTINGVAIDSNYCTWGDIVLISYNVLDGYHITSFTVDGVTVTGDTYELTMPKHDVTVSVTFAKDTFTNVYVVDGGHGTVSGSPSGAVAWGTQVTVTTTPDARYVLDTLDGTPATISNNKFTQPKNIETVTAKFKKNVFDITCSNDGNGTCKIGSVTTTTGTAGSTITVTADPTNSTIYEFDHITVNGESRGSGVNTFPMPYEDVAVVAYYRKKSFTITCQNDGHGTCTTTPSGSCQWGETVTVNATPSSSNYIFSYFTLNGTSQGDGSTSFEMQQANVTVKAFFRDTNGLVVSKSTGSLPLYHDSYSTHSTSCTLIGTFTSSGSSSVVTCSWTSSNTSVATVNSSGVVTAVGAGTTTITATYGIYTDTFEVTVSEYDSYLYVGMSSGSSTIYHDSYSSNSTTCTLYARYYYGSSYDTKTTSCTWTSSNTNVATVSSSGVVTPKAAGTVTITGTWNGLSNTYIITVRECTYSLSLSPTSVSVLAGETATVTPTFTIKRGTTTVQTITNTTALTWSPASNTYASVSGGTVTGIKKGTTTFTATKYGQTATLSVEVTVAIVSTTYDNPTITEFTTNDIPATGGTVSSAKTLKYTQYYTITYTDGSTSRRSTSMGATISYGSAVTAGGAAPGALRQGVGTLSATVTMNGKSTTGTATVYQEENAGVLYISASPSGVVIGNYANLTAKLRYATGEETDVTSSTTFASNANGIAYVSGTRAYGNGSGTATITGTYGTQTATCYVKSGTESEMVMVMSVVNNTPEYGSVVVDGGELIAGYDNLYTVNMGSTPEITVVPSNSRYYLKQALDKDVSEWGFGEESTQYDPISYATAEVTSGAYSSSYPTTQTELDKLIGNYASATTYATCYVAPNRGVTVFKFYFNTAGLESTIKEFSNVICKYKIRRNNSSGPTISVQGYVGDTPVGTAQTTIITSTNAPSQYNMTEVNIGDNPNVIFDPDFHLRVTATLTASTNTATYLRLYIYGAEIARTGTPYDFSTTNGATVADVTSSMNKNDADYTYTLPAISSNKSFEVTLDDAEFMTKHSSLGWNYVNKVYKKIDGAWTEVNLYNNTVHKLNSGIKFRNIGCDDIVVSLGGYVLLNEYTSAGTYNISIPSSVDTVYAFVVGGGGGGAGHGSSSGQSGGGGNGGCVNSYEITGCSGSTLSIQVGAGGSAGAYQKSGSAGTASYVQLGSTKYQSDGGYGGIIVNTTTWNVEEQTNSGHGGQGTWGASPDEGNCGKDGLSNPYDTSDTNLYGAGGGGGGCPYRGLAAGTGGNTGGGAGGSGSNNTSANAGNPGTFYGAGGGGGGFNSQHAASYSTGGTGYQGCVKIYKRTIAETSSGNMFKHFKWVVNGAYNNSQFQYSELELINAVGDSIPLTYVSTNMTSMGSTEGPANLVDGNMNTKCYVYTLTVNAGQYMIFSSTGKHKISQMRLRTANDNNPYQRYATNWSLYGSNDDTPTDSGNWTLLKTFTAGAEQAVNYTWFTYDI